MKRTFLFLLLACFTAMSATAQFGDSAWRARQQLIRQESLKDYQDMLQQLGITVTRPGPSGDPKAPNAANADESKATTYTELPDPLLLQNGQRVTTANEWWSARRPELVEIFDRDIYGRMPAGLPTVQWTVTEKKDDTIGGIPVEVRTLKGTVDNSSYPAIAVHIDCSLVLPKARKKVPVIIEFGFVLPPGFRFPDPKPGEKKITDWKEQVVARGYGYAILIPTSFQADNGAGLREGIIGLANKGAHRKPDDWGTLRAWAWGASRTIDYLETLPEVNAQKIAIEGLSRYGKAALVAMAYEPRLSIGFIGSSGAGGAKLLRRNFGEQVENLASDGGYHWFAGNFIRYAGPLQVNQLPIDAHELIALAAPRPIFIGVGSPLVEGNWIDGKGNFLGGAYASPVYELLGKKGLGTSTMPPMETFLSEGEIAFRQHSGGHTNAPNWQYFLDYTMKYWGKK